jgi:polyhydroxyalkanoate synthesis regulator phasin
MGRSVYQRNERNEWKECTFSAPCHSLNTLHAKGLFMECRQQAKQPQNVAYTSKTRRRKKANTPRPKHRFSGGYQLKKSNIVPSEEIVKRTLDRLRGLGNQTFAIFPFSEYFDDWLENLRGVLSDFELDSDIAADDQFNEQCSQILSNLELALEERRNKEASYDLATKSLSEDRRVLERIDEDYAVKMGEMERRKNGEVKHLSRTVQDLKEELDRITQTKTGIFRPMSRKAKAQKVAEASQKLNLAYGKLDLIVPNFSAERQRLLTEHTKMQRPVMERIQNLQKEVNSIEIDSSSDARRAACEALTNVVSALLKRKMLLLQ